MVAASIEDRGHDRVVVERHDRARKSSQELTICGIAVDETHDRVEVEPVLVGYCDLECLTFRPTAVARSQCGAQSLTSEPIRASVVAYEKPVTAGARCPAVAAAAKSIRAGSCNDYDARLRAEGAGQRGLGVIHNDHIDTRRPGQPGSNVCRMLWAAQTGKTEARDSRTGGRDQGRQSLERIGLQQHVQGRLVKTRKDLAVLNQDSARCGSSGIDPKHR